jgi:hypothetical protein
MKEVLSDFDCLLLKIAMAVTIIGMAAFALEIIFRW